MGNTMIRFPMKVLPSLCKNCNRVRAYGFSDYLRACHRRAASADARRATAGAELGAAVAHIVAEAAAVAAVARIAAEAAAVAAVARIAAEAAAVAAVAHIAAEAAAVAAAAHVAAAGAAVAAVAHIAAEAAAVAEAAVAEAARIPGGVAAAVVGPRSAPSSSPAAGFALDSPPDTGSARDNCPNVLGTPDGIRPLRRAQRHHLPGARRPEPWQLESLHHAPGRC